MIHYREGLKYQLARKHTEFLGIYPNKPLETDWIKLSPEGKLSIRAGYAWDGPSGPTIDTPSAMTGSLVHDAIYQLIRLGYLPATAREAADKEYRRILIEDGKIIAERIRKSGWTGPVRAEIFEVTHNARVALHFDALRVFGGFSAEPSAERQILTAP